MTEPAHTEWRSEPTGWQDLPVGARARTQGVTVTEAHVVGWAGLTGDWYPLHMDEEFAKRSPFGQRIVHGPLSFALAIGMTVQAQLYGRAALAELGVNDVRFLAPVLIGDTLIVETTVVGSRATSRGDRGVVTVLYEVLKHGDEPVMTFELVVLMASRDDSEAI